MKKKAKVKSGSGALSAPARGKPAKPGSAARGKAKPAAKQPPKPKPGSKPGSTRSGARKTAPKGAAKAQPAAKAPSSKAGSAKAKPAAKAKSTRTAKPSASASPPKPSARAQAKAGTRGKPRNKAKGQGGVAEPAAGALLRKVAPKLREEAERDTEVILAPELIARSLPESVPAEDEGALRNVMSSLSALFGGRDDLSDAELDALLDSKMASGEIPPSAALDPLDEAQSLVYEAWNSEGPQRARLARKALETSPDCADAYVILAEEDARDGQQALELFRKGVAAGERAVAPEVFRDSAGRFWDVMEARPYMRARLGLAECLWEQGMREEALGHLAELLRLDPADHQGVRKILERRRREAGAEPG